MRNDIINESVVSHKDEPILHRQMFATLPDGVRIFAWVRAIRWFGWGFGESLLPVFIMTFSHTFAEAGLFSSTVEIVSLICLPIIGIWADSAPAKRLVLWSMILYPLVGVSYLLAGIFGLALFVVVARGINGFTWELENVGIATYYRRAIAKNRIATSFGYLDTWTNLAWIAAALIGMFLVSFMPIHFLLFVIAPFSVAAYFVALRVPRDVVSTNTSAHSSTTSWNPGIAQNWRSWISRFWLLGTIVFFSSIVNSLTTFFIPIAAYLAGANLPMVVLISVLGATPSLFGYLLGHVADKCNRYGLIAFGLCCVAFIAVCLFVIHSYWFKLVAVFLLGIVLELFYVVQSSLITTLGPEHTYGRRGSAFEIISTFGDLAAPLILGVALDVLGFSNVTVVMGFVAIALAITFYLRKREV